MLGFMKSKSVIAAALVAALLGAAAFQAGYGTEEVAAQGSGLNRIQADNACYVQLPDLPTGSGIGRYGAFGGYNEDTGILVFAGGGEKRGSTGENTIVYSDMFALDMTQTGNDWRKINYSANNGYNTDTDRGCREMSSVRIEADRWLSVFGKDGCDGGGDGDIKEIEIGDSATSSQVRFRANSGVQGAPPELEDNKLELLRTLAVWDSQRNRMIVGQGTYDDAIETESNADIYEATASGARWNVRELRPTGNVPSRRFGTCGAYVHDADQGLDGVLVLGGKQGGNDGADYAEVWWLDFSTSRAGVWNDISGLFSNLKADPNDPTAPYLSYRREGACGYNPDTKQFYTWMGRASSGIPDGSSRSKGIWRTDLSNLAAAVNDATGMTKLTWERLAKDNLAGLDGRRLIPSVYDWKNNRVFAMGGRNDVDEYKDVWVIYPDVTGADCQSLDPFGHFAPGPTETPMPSPTTNPNETPMPTDEVPTVEPSPTIDLAAQICDAAKNKVPGAVVNAATGNPQTVAGYGLRCNPNLAAGPLNPERTWLSLRNPGLPYHPLFNGLAWKCGCP